MEYHYTVADAAFLDDYDDDARRVEAHRRRDANARLANPVQLTSLSHSQSHSLSTP